MSHSVGFGKDDDGDCDDNQSMIWTHLSAIVYKLFCSNIPIRKGEIQ